MNIVEFGNFVRWPLGTSFSLGTGTVARTTLFPNWSFNKLHANQPAVVISRQSFDVGDTLSEGSPLYYLRVNPTGAGTATAAATYARLTYTVPNGRYVSSRNAIIRFWARASVQREIVVTLHQFLGTGGAIPGTGDPASVDIVHVQQSIQLRTAWQPYEIKVRIPNTSTYTFDTDDALSLRFYLQGGSTYLGNDAVLWSDSNVDVAQVSMDVLGVDPYPVAEPTTIPIQFGIDISGDEATDVTTGTSKRVWRAPYAMTITDVRATLSTVSSSGLPTVDINESGTTILSTKLSIDANEKSSVSAATPAVISDWDIADNAELTFDVDVAGTGAKGLKVWIYGYRNI